MEMWNGALDTGELAGKVTGLKRDHGVALVPELGRGFISDGDAAQIVIFDLKTFKTIGQIKGEPDAAFRYVREYFER